MHPYVTPEPIKARILQRLGKPFATEFIDPARTALVVIDMQNHYVAEGFPAQVPVARAIVPNINRLIAGTKTNVCCESTARDASMRNFRVIMLADANATSSDAEHAATLDTFSLYFGDVMNVEEAIARIRR